MAMKIMESRAKMVLVDISSSHDAPMARTLQKLEKARSFADTLWSTKIFGQSFFANSWSIYGILSQFQCIYETELEASARALLLNMPTVLHHNNIGLRMNLDAYLSAVIRHAKEVLKTP
jgi:hypothetical protein